MNRILTALLGADDPPHGMQPIPEPTDLDECGLRQVESTAHYFYYNFPRECHEIIRAYLLGSGLKAYCTSLEFGIQRYQNAIVELSEENRKLREYMDAEIVL